MTKSLEVWVIPSRTTSIPSPLEVFATYSGDAPSVRTRVLSWVDKSGIDCRVHQYAHTRNHQVREIARALPRAVSAEVSIRQAIRKGFARTLIHREVSPFSGGNLEGRVAAASQLCVYDFDDALMHLPKRGAHRLWAKAAACETALRNSDRVIAGSEYLADWASTRNSDVRLIPTCIDPADYQDKTDYSLGASVNLVWIGSPSTERYLSQLARPLELLNLDVDVRLTVISSGNATLGPLAPFVDRVEWYPGIERGLQEFDVGVAPLTDGPIERGKCAYKVLQYAAAGLPVVASPVGANRTVINDLNLSGVDSEQAWVTALRDYIEASHSDRAVVGHRARNLVGERYSFSSWLSEWLDAVGEPGAQGLPGVARS